MRAPGWPSCLYVRLRGTLYSYSYSLFLTLCLSRRRLARQPPRASRHPALSRAECGDRARGPRTLATLSLSPPARAPPPARKKTLSALARWRPPHSRPHHATPPAPPPCSPPTRPPLSLAPTATRQPRARQHPHATHAPPLSPSRHRRLTLLRHPHTHSSFPQPSRLACGLRLSRRPRLSAATIACGANASLALATSALAPPVPSPPPLPTPAPVASAARRHPYLFFFAPFFSLSAPFSPLFPPLPPFLPTPFSGNFFPDPVTSRVHTNLGDLSVLSLRF